MKKLYTLVFILFAGACLGQDKVGFLVAQSGERIDFFPGDVTLSGEFVQYYDVDGRPRKFKQVDVKEIEFGKRRYINLPASSKIGTVLQEIIAENNQYLLSQFYHDGFNYFCVFSRDNMRRKGKEQWHSQSMMKDRKLFDKKIRPYFGDCPELLERIRYGIENSSYRPVMEDGVLMVKDNMFRYVTNLDCAGLNNPPITLKNE